jgi:coenzyme F420-dependent glucose-6-phosphate dehydrogenase
MRIGFHASHEQFSPRKLLSLAQSAEQAGFKAILSSDHVTPWSNSQGNCGFAWTWLGAAMQATSVPFSVVTVSGYRYHPVVLAQAVATLSNMFPGRFTLAMGSGEALNEHVVGGKWPVKAVRNEVLQESADIMRRLWRGEMVTSQGHLIVEEAKLYTLSKEPPVIIGAGLTPETARWLGGWADGFITTSDSLPILKERVEAFRQGGGQGKPMILKAQLSYDKTYEEALQGAYEQWRYTLLPSDVMGHLKTAAHFEAAGGPIGKDLVGQKVKISHKPQELVDWIHQLAELGFEEIILHNVNRKQEQFIKDFGQLVLSGFRTS